MVLAWKPWLRCSHNVAAGVLGELTEALTTSRCRWSLSERPQSFITLPGSVGELKNASPRSFIDFDSV